VYRFSYLSVVRLIRIVNRSDKDYVFRLKTEGTLEVTVKTWCFWLELAPAELQTDSCFVHVSMYSQLFLAQHLVVIINNVEACDKGGRGA
jgi:hypothetical protein